MPVTADDVAPNEWECKVFIAVAEARSYSAAASRLSKQLGREYGRRAVSDVIRKINRWLSEETFAGPGANMMITACGERFLVSARDIVHGYQVMRGQNPAPAMSTLACLPHHVHFVARAEAVLRGAPDPIAVRYLDRRYAAEQEFAGHAIYQLKRNAFQLVIGPPAGGDRDLLSQPLYQARLEALVPDCHLDAIPLADLLRDHVVSAPVEHPHTRRLLDEKIAEAGLPDPHRDLRDLESGHDLASQVLRLLVEQESAGTPRAILAPSDATFTIKKYWKMEGEAADRFGWIPVVHTGSDGTPAPLRSPVSITVRRGEAAKLYPVIAALREAVTELPELHGGQSRGNAPRPRAG